MRAPKPPTVPPTAPPIVAASDTLLSSVLEGCGGVAVVEDADEETRLGVVDVAIDVGVDAEVDVGIGVEVGSGVEVGIGVEVGVDVGGAGVVVEVVGDTTGMVGVSVTTTVVTAAVGRAEWLNAAI